MTASEWILSREPRPPAPLLTRIESALKEVSASELPSISSRLLAAAIGILSGRHSGAQAQVSSGAPHASDAPDADQPDADQPDATDPSAQTPDNSAPTTSVRPEALDLLAADALITYAMEASSDDCASVASVAESAMRIICSLESHVA